MSVHPFFFQSPTNGAREGGGLWVPENSENIFVDH